MNVEIAEERILLLSDNIGAEQARSRSWAKRNEAFGAFARIGGLISRPKDEDYEVAYHKLRLQPFWRIAASTTYVYERQRPHKLKVGAQSARNNAENASRSPSASRLISRSTSDC